MLASSNLGAVSTNFSTKQTRSSPLLLVCKAANTRAQAEKDSELERQSSKRRLRFHRLEQTPEERTAREKPLLSQAKSSLAEYCSTLPGDNEDSERCWAAYDYFEQRKDEAESGCEIDYSTGQRSGPDCSKLDSFESFVRQLVGHSPMSSFAHLLYTLRKAELHDQHPQGGSSEITQVKGVNGESHFELRNVPKTGRERLVALFQAMDRDGNGQLDTAEFRDAMNKLGMQHLTGATVSTILSAMDIHGPISLDDFLQIVEAEEIYSDTPVSRWLRAKRGESKFWGNPIESM